MNDAMYYFEKISSIPRASGNCGGAADFLCDFAHKNGLSVFRDGKDNVIIKKAAAPGRQSEAPVMLQGHIDMVCACRPGVDFDFQNNGIKLIIDGDTLRADGTTLGADDGAAVAVMLAILADKSADAPELECVFTADEEIGMLGAAQLDLSSCRAKCMINMDSDEEGVFTCGCAGGERVDFTIPVKREPVSANGCLVEITGLCGGHSGTEINKGRLNAVKLLASLLDGEHLVSMDKDGKDNAIPADCRAVLLGDGEKVKKRFADIKDFGSETGVKLTVTPLEYKEYSALDAQSSEKILNFIKTVPNGVRKMCDEPKGLVHTSDNLGIIKTEESKICGAVSVRSTDEGSKKELTAEIARTVEKAGGKVTVHGGYPGWNYRKNSPLRDTMTSIYEEMFGKTPKTDVIHAGLECGLILSKMPELDIVSVGCDLRDIHTPDETMSISSFNRLEKFIRKVLKEIRI